MDALRVRGPFTKRKLDRPINNRIRGSKFQFQNVSFRRLGSGWNRRGHSIFFTSLLFSSVSFEITRGGIRWKLTGGASRKNRNVNFRRLRERRAIDYYFALTWIAKARKQKMALVKRPTF